MVYLVILEELVPFWVEVKHQPSSEKHDASSHIAAFFQLAAMLLPPIFLQMLMSDRQSVMSAPAAKGRTGSSAPVGRPGKQYCMAGRAPTDWRTYQCSSLSS